MTKSEIDNINVKLQDRFESYCNGFITVAEYLSHCRLIIQDGIDDYRTNLEYQVDVLYDQLKQLDNIEE